MEVWRLRVALLCWITTICSATNFQYQLVTTPKTFINADDHCQQIVNGHLARVYDKTTSDNIKAFLVSQGVSSGRYWLGARSTDDSPQGVLGTNVGSRLWRWFSASGESSFLLSQGCYVDDPSSSELQRFIKDNSTVTECVNLCRVQDFKYAALKLRENCYCTNVFGRLGTIIANTGSGHNCDKKCKRDPNGLHHCGGQYNDVYSLFRIGGVAGVWNLNAPNNDARGNQQCGRLQSKWDDRYRLDDLECFEKLHSLCVDLESCSGAGENSFTAGGRSYCLITTNYTWYEADTLCRGRGGRLADLSDAGDFTAATSAVSNIDGALNIIWIGMAAHEWTWTEPSGAISYWDWASNEPSGLNTGQKCVLMSGSSGTWSDEACTSSHPFICQIDEDECSVTSPPPCGSGAQCVNTPGSYECRCSPGYTLNNGDCTDINECVTSHQCHSDAVCTNTEGSYTCACRPGYVGNGITCTQVVAECADSSLNNCDVNARCIELDVGFDCSCLSGFVGDGSFCIDVNECSSSNLNDCAVEATCTNTPGSYTCTCPPGYQAAPNACTDVDECSSSNNCDVNAVCSNLPGTYTCTCSGGYTGDGLNCNDVDECGASSPPCDVNAACINLPGSYQCTCNTGYTGDGTTCTVAPSTLSSQNTSPPTAAPGSTGAAQTTSPDTSGGDTTTAGGAVAPSTPGAATSSGGLGTAEIILSRCVPVLIVVCMLLILLIILLFACVIYYKRKNNDKNKVAIDNNYDARPEAPVAYGGNLGEDYYYSSSEAGSTAGLVVPNKTSSSRTMTSHPRPSRQPRIMLDDDKY